MRCEKQNNMLLKNNRVGLLSVFLRDNKKDDCREVYCLGCFLICRASFIALNVLKGVRTACRLKKKYNRMKVIQLLVMV